MKVQIVMGEKSFDLEADDVLVLRKSLQNTMSFFERLLAQDKIEKNRIDEFKNRKGRARALWEILSD